MVLLQAGLETPQEHDLLLGHPGKAGYEGWRVGGTVRQGPESLLTFSLLDHSNEGFSSCQTNGTPRPRP